MLNVLCFGLLFVQFSNNLDRDQGASVEFTKPENNEIKTDKQRKERAKNIKLFIFLSNVSFRLVDLALLVPFCCDYILQLGDILCKGK